MSDLIPNNLPYRKLPRDKIDTENLTWFNYIIGRFSGEMWYDRDDIEVSAIGTTRYGPIPFPEELNNLHLWFLGKIEENKNHTNLPWVKNGYDRFEKWHFCPDTQCRFDIWTLYNHSPEKVSLEIGGTTKIGVLPEQEDIKNVPLLHDTVPSDVPLIFGPQRYALVGDPEAPHRPFVRNNSQIPDFTTIKDRIRYYIDQQREEKRRQQRQDAQYQRKKRQKRKRRQQRQYEQHHRKQKSNVAADKRDLIEEPPSAFE